MTTTQSQDITVTDAVGVEWHLGERGQLEAHLNGAWRDDHGLTVTTERVRALAPLAARAAGAHPLDFRALVALFEEAADGICEAELLSKEDAQLLDRTSALFDRLLGPRPSRLERIPA